MSVHWVNNGSDRMLLDVFGHDLLWHFTLTPILRIGRKPWSLPCEGLNGVAGIDISGTLVPGIHGVSNSAGRPAVTDASHRAYTRIRNSIGV